MISTLSRHIDKKMHINNECIGYISQILFVINYMISSLSTSNAIVCIGTMYDTYAMFTAEFVESRC